MSDTQENAGFSSELPNMGELSNIINALKENPQILSSVFSALGANSHPDAAAPSDSQPLRNPEAAADKLPEMVSALAPLLADDHFSQGKGAPAQSDHKTALLYALRPYLSPERREIIDYILKFSKLGELIKKLK